MINPNRPPVSMPLEVIAGGLSFGLAMLAGWLLPDPFPEEPILARAAKLFVIITGFLVGCWIKRT